MPNHVYLIVVPERATGMAQAMGRTNADYARYYNLRQRTCGHVWQARYFSTPLEDAHLWAMIYVERNPVRARMVAQAEEFAWSSARTRRTGESGMVDLGAWRAAYNRPQWREVLETSIGEEAIGERLQEASRRGRPLGGEEFTEELERRCGRRLGALPAGRPRKSGAQEERQMGLEFGV